MPFRTVDGVVGGNVEVAGVVAELQVLVDAAVSFGLGVASGESVTELLSFLVSLVCPNASQSVVCRSVLVEEVHREHAEQKGATTTEENDVVVFRDAHQFTEVLFRLGEHVFNRL